jgi:hypothetical protein
VRIVATDLNSNISCSATTTSALKPSPTGSHRNSDLPSERGACAPQLDTQALFVDGFQQGRPRVPVHLDRSPMTCSVNDSDDLFGQ